MRTIQVEYKKEKRNLTVQDAEYQMDIVLERLRQLFDIPPEENICLNYEDARGNLVSVATQEKLLFCLRFPFKLKYKIVPA